MRAVSWDSVGSLTSRSGAQGLTPTPEDTFSDRDKIFKTSGYNDFSAQSGSKHKLSKLKEVKYFEWIRLRLSDAESLFLRVCVYVGVCLFVYKGAQADL